MIQSVPRASLVICVFFFNDTATTEIYTLSLHDALPISESVRGDIVIKGGTGFVTAKSIEGEIVVEGARGKVSVSSVNEGIKISDTSGEISADRDRKSTRLNSSHLGISYAVFCLKKKKKK